MENMKSYDNAFALLTDDLDGQAEYLHRSTLMNEINDYIFKENLSPKSATLVLGTTKGRIKALREGSLNLLPLDVLLSIRSKF